MPSFELLNALNGAVIITIDLDASNAAVSITATNNSGLTVTASLTNPSNQTFSRQIAAGTNVVPLPAGRYKLLARIPDAEHSAFKTGWVLSVSTGP